MLGDKLCKFAEAGSPTLMVVRETGLSCSLAPIAGRVPSPPSITPFPPSVTPSPLSLHTSFPSLPLLASHHSLPVTAPPRLPSLPLPSHHSPSPITLPPHLPSLSLPTPPPITPSSHNYTVKCRRRCHMLWRR